MSRIRRVVVTLAVLAALVPASGTAPALAATDPTGYEPGPYDGRLCPAEGVASTLCSVHRETRAALQGAEHRSDVTAEGAACEQQGGLWVCFGVTSALAQRGGTTYGDTFLTARAAQVLDAGLVEHELEHVRQWRLFGPSFSLLYLREGSEACENYFEEQAGLDAGGYACG